MIDLIARALNLNPSKQSRAHPELAEKYLNETKN